MRRRSSGLPLTVGWDVTGVVDAVGSGVTRFAVGDPVFGMPWFPRAAAAYAEFVTAPSRHFARRPDALPVEQAAGLSLAGLTAWQCLVDIARGAAGPAGADPRRGRRCGPPGRADRQGARGTRDRDRVARPSTTCSPNSGVDEAVDYRSQKFEDVVEPVDVVYDLIGGDVAERSLDVLRPDGIQISLPSAAAAGGGRGGARPGACAPSA